MFRILKKWRRRRIIRRSGITLMQWQGAFADLPLLDRLSAQERQGLRELAILFLHDKVLEGAGEVVITRRMALLIALQACLPILWLGLDWYRSWSSVIVYADGFYPEREYTDEAGVVHRVKRMLSGESWLRGPVIFAWSEACQAGRLDGNNLVIHEFAHKLDMLNGLANGFPPLHSDMSTAHWSEVFGQAYEDFQARWHFGKPLPIDGYAAESPAEFFAVLSEVFFELPERVQQYYPAVYEQLKAFYRQDPLLQSQS